MRRTNGSAERGRRIGLALAGGGPKGAIYEIGALRALEDSIEGLDLTALDIYVGVSGGAFLAACLANNLTPRQMAEGILGLDRSEPPFGPETFFTPAYREILRRAATLPRLLAESLRDYRRRPGDLTLREALTRLARALPVGFFDNEPIGRYLERIFARQGRTNDFRRLGRTLVVVAADLDSGAAVRFGQAGMDHVPISKAVEASTALPGLYPPVVIEGRSYVDGVLLKTLHGSLALDAGAELLLCINPIVPVDTARAVDAGVMVRGRLVDRGLGAVVSQALRTLIRSRLEAGMAAYERRYRDADVVLFEPRRDDYEMFFTNIFSFSERRAACQLGYERTRQDLLAREVELAEVLERHGLALRREVLLDPTRGAFAPPGDAGLEPPPVAARLGRALDRLEALLEEELPETVH